MILIANVSWYLQLKFMRVDDYLRSSSLNKSFLANEIYDNKNYGSVNTKKVVSMSHLLFRGTYLTQTHYERLYYQISILRKTYKK